MFAIVNNQSGNISLISSFQSVGNQKPVTQKSFLKYCHQLNLFNSQEVLTFVYLICFLCYKCNYISFTVL